MKTIKSLADAKTALENRITDGNKLIANGKLSADFLTEFTPIEEAYANFKMREVYGELKAKELPKHEAIKLFEYEVLKHKVIRDKESRKIIKLELDKRTNKITPESFAKYMGDEETGWKNSFRTLSLMFTFKAMLEIGADTTSECIFIQNLAKEQAAGKEPVSNNKLTKAMQAAIDDYLSQDETTKNPVKCNNHDVAYIAGCYSSAGAERHSLKAISDSVFSRLMMRAMSRALTNGKYSYIYTIKKGEKTVTMVFDKKSTAKAAAKTSKKSTNKKAA